MGNADLGQPTRAGTEVSAGHGEPLRRGAEVQATTHAAPRIVVVDDDRGMRLSIGEVLHAAGYQCTAVADGGQALELLRRQPVDLLLLDLKMPQVDGYQVMRAVSAAHPDTDMVVISGETTFESATLALRHGAREFLRKPVDPIEMVRVVENILQSRRLRAELQHVSSQLEASEQRYRFIVDNSPDIVYMLDPDGRFAFVNQRVVEMLGFLPEELLGTHYTELVCEEDLEKAHYAFNERRTGVRASSNQELRLKCNDAVADYRYFENRSITIELNAVGMYGGDGPADAQAQDFLGTYGVARDITERKRAEELLNFQLFHDLLTKLPNRALFRDRLELALSQARRQRGRLAVMYLDMDRFKVVNDSLGHLAGDQLLQQVASRLQQCLRESDTLARVGGDEFNLLLPDISGPEDAAGIARKLIESFERPIRVDGHDVFVSFSIGIGIYPDDGNDLDALVKNADAAMYHVKSQGKNDFALFDTVMVGSRDNALSLESDLRESLAHDAFELVFQPQMRTDTRAVVGMEALLRWHHPDRGLVLPGQFIEVAEASGLIVPIGDWVIEMACRELSHWRTSGFAQPIMAVNVSAVQLQQADFARSVLNAIDRHGVDGRHLEIEITENVLMRDMDRAVSQLRELGQRGVRIAVDDFGTGYSSLGYLESLPLNTLKTDRSFLREVQSKRDRSGIVTAVHAITQELGLEMIAEGVESQIQLDYLRAIGCSKGQGFLFGRPLGAIDARRLLARVNPQPS